MKYSLVLAFILSVICLSVCASEDRYIEALRNCSAYTDSGSVDVEGISTTSTKHIYGWENGKCKYKEIISMNGINANMSCNFTKSQIHEITSVADAYFTTLKYSQSQPELNSLDSVKNNPLANVFNKYIQDPSVCTMEIK